MRFFDRLFGSRTPTTPRRRLTLGVGVNLCLESPANTLRGAVPDAINMRRLLLARGYAANQVPLTDYRATRRACLELIGNTITGLTPDHDLVITWSSHGVQTADPREPDGIVEALCPTDCMMDWPRNLITAYDLAALFRQARDGVRILLIADACHSSPPPSDTGYLTRNPHPTKARSLITEHAAHPTPGQAVRSIAAPGGEWKRTAILTGCASHETSADAFIDGSYQGAMTASLIACAERNSVVELRDLYRAILGSVKSAGFRQTPALQGPECLLRHAWF